MLLICPQCHKAQTVLPTALLGRYFICEFCHAIEPWKVGRDLYEQRIPNEIEKSAGADHHNDGANPPIKSS